MNTIHEKWLRPMPRWWHDFYERDAEILEVEQVYRRKLANGELICKFCGEAFEPKNPSGNLRVRCYDPECEKARKRENARLSAQRVAKRKEAA